MSKMLILTLALMLTLSAANATQLQVSGDLTAEQQASLILQAEKMAAKSITSPIDQAKNVREWVVVGSAVGEGLAAAAGKLGLEVNKFADTKVGIFTMVIIAYNYVGSELISILFGSTFLLFGIPI